MANRIREEVSKRSANSKHFLNDDGSYTAELSSGAIHYEHAAGDWLDIDTTTVLSDDPGYDFMCVTTDVPAYFKKEISDADDNVKIVKGGVTIRVKSVTGLKLSSQAGAKAAKTLAKAKSEKVNGKGNKVRYSSIYSHGRIKIDIDYDVIAGKLHEEFICSEAMGFPEITQEVSIDGGYAVRDGKAILIWSTATGEVVLTIPPPVMFEQGAPEAGNYGLDYEITGNLGGTFTITKVLESVGRDWFFAAERQYPLIVDTDFAGVAEVSPVGSSSSYSYARSNAGSYFNGIYVGQDYNTGSYNIYRGFVKFDTSSIGSSATVSAVAMSLSCRWIDTSWNDFNVQIVKYNWASLIPISSHFQTAYAGCLSATVDDNIWRNTYGASINTPYTSGSLSTAWINKTGVTYYSLRCDYDYLYSVPAGPELVSFSAENDATPSYRPKLIVTYSTVTTPTVTTQAVSSPATTSGTGNGNITATGGANATRRGFCYMTGTSGDPTTADSAAYDDGDFGTGAYTKSITGLSAGTAYRVRAYAVNSAGTSYGSTVSYTALPTGAMLLLLLAR